MEKCSGSEPAFTKRVLNADVELIICEQMPEPNL